MRNPSMSAKKKFSILFKLMKNNKHCNIPPLIENDIIVQDSTEQSHIFNKYFASKSTVPKPKDPVPLNNIKKSYIAYCGIPGKFIHLISTPISFSLSRLFNN